MLRRIAHIFRTVFLLILCLLIGVWVLLHFSPVQTWLVQKASEKLSDQLKTEVSVKKVDFSIFKKIILEGVIVRDQHKDTLLYSGRMIASFNNWFIFKNDIVVKEVGLEHSYANIHRSDSVWNYQFIVDAFSTPQSDKPKKKIKIQIEYVHLNDIRVIKKDEWIGEDMQLSLARLELKADKIQLDKQLLKIKDLFILQPDFTVYNYDGKRPPKIKIPEEIFHRTTDTVRQPFAQGWDIHAHRIQIENGRFTNLLKKGQPTPYFDSDYIEFNDIKASFKNLKIKGDSLLARLDLYAKERSGLTIKQLSSNINWHSRAMEFHQLLLETNHSKLSDYFAMKYKYFNHDMNHFDDHVIMEGDFRNSTISSKDLTYFAPSLYSLNESLKFKGKISGTLHHIIGQNLLIQGGRNTVFAGNMSVKEILSTNKLSFDIEAKSLKTQFVDIVRYFPEVKSIKKPDIPALGAMQYKGTITGDLSKFKINGSLNSALGTISTGLSITIPSIKNIALDGNVSTSGFNLGRFLNIPKLGYTALESSFTIEGLNTGNLRLNLSNKIQLLEYSGYKYKNIVFNTDMQNNIINGSIDVNDHNIALKIDGRINRLPNDTLQIQLKGDVPKICLNELGLIKKDIRYKGSIDANFKVKTFDDFEGYILLDNSSLYEQGTELPFHNLLVRSEKKEDGIQSLEIQSDFIDASLSGKYALSKIGSIGNKLLSVYFPSYFTSTYNINDLQEFSFNVKTENIEPFLQFFNLPISGGNQSSLTGYANTATNIYYFKSIIPNLKIGAVELINIDLESNNDNSGMNVHTNIDLIGLSDSLKIPNTAFDLTASNDTGSVNIRTSISETFKNANLRSKFSLFKDGINIEFLKSSFFLNEKEWNIEKESEIFIGRNNLFSEGILLTSGNEEIKLFTHPSEIGSYNDVAIEVRKVEMGELLPYFFKDPRIEGTTTGRIDVLDPLGNLEIESKLTTEKLRINNDSIGIIPLITKYDHRKKELTYKVSSDNLGHVFQIKGSVNFFKSDSIYTDNIIEINNESLRILEPYLSGILSGITGTGTGMLKIYGSIDKLKMTGSVRLNQASLVIDYTKCRYNIMPGANIEFREDIIDFGNILLRDTAGRIASFNGDITHDFFSDMAFNLQFEAMNKNKGLLVLNTTSKDNSLFYGQIVAYANGIIRGPADNITIKLRGQPTDSSRIYLPTEESKVTGTASFIVFRQYGTDLKASTTIKAGSSLNVDLDVIANPYAKVFLILDEVTNDIIEGQGNGAINLRVGTNKNTTITGNYEITRGKYNFNWQSLFKKPFLINKGTINWTGDPYDARINIDANYIVEQVKLPDELASGCSNERSNILVVANLSNTLKNPSIKFRFELPQGHPCRNNPLTNTGLAQLYNNPDELNRQVISLLLIGSFISNTPNQSATGGGLGNTFFSSAAGTLSEFIAQQVTTGLGAVLRNVPGLKDLELDPYVTFTPGLITSSQAEGIGFQGTGSFGFTRRLLNGRMLVKAGGSMLVATGQNTTVQNNRQLTPDVSIEWLITPDGKLRLIGFYRTVFDIQRRNDRTGVSFSYVKEFDKIW